MEPNTNTIIIYSPCSKSIALSLFDILLDETLAYGTIYVPTDCFKKVSQMNHRLPAKKEYELLLRLAEQYPIVTSDSVPLNSSNYYLMRLEESALSFEGLQTDCYILSRYKKILLSNSIFDAATESILQLATSLGRQEELLSFMSLMITETEDFLYYDLGSAPFLIYTGETICYEILSVFAKQIGDALCRLGNVIEYYDFSKKELSESTALIGRRFQAIVGVQTYMFSVRMDNGIDFLHDYIIGPKYNIVLDHPARFDNHLAQTPKYLTILTLDRNYAAFAEKYYSVSTQFLPPGGIPGRNTAYSNRPIGISLIASYNEISVEELRTVHQLPRTQRFFINRLWLILRSNPRLTAEAALSKALIYYNLTLDNAQFLSLYKELIPYINFITSYYRTQVLKVLLDAGFPVDVYGASWSTCPLRTHPNFIWHNKDLSTDECLEVWQNSKLALNVMSWHKDAITERILNSMLQKSVVITERNPYVCEAFEDEKDLLLYDLVHLKDLPRKVKVVLEDTSLCQDIAESGYQKALAAHTWDNRASQIIELAKGMK